MQASGGALRRLSGLNRKGLNGLNGFNGLNSRSAAPLGCRVTIANNQSLPGGMVLPQKFQQTLRYGGIIDESVMFVSFVYTELKQTKIMKKLFQE